VGALGLSWKERVAFVLAEDLAVKAIKYPEIVRNESGVDPELDAAARFDADFALMSLELDQLAAELIEVFGIAED
ncbi:MAG TPA: recombination-associated protein RdgC, partial [Pseudomonadales bacterium]|nr:recombination-associated protein RdgC [Pseudomonadales bacterium]